MTGFDPSYLQNKLKEAASFLSKFQQPDNSADELIAIKIRPIESETEVNSCYVYPAEYTEIYAYLNSLATSVGQEKQWVARGGKATIYLLGKDSSGTDQYFLFVEHETGPELIAYLHTIQGVLVAGTQATVALGAFLVAVNKVVHIIRQSIAEHAISSNSRRHYKAGAIAVASRSAKKGERPIRTIKPNATEEDAIQAPNEVV